MGGPPHPSLAGGSFLALPCYFATTPLATRRELLKRVESYPLPQSPAKGENLIADNERYRKPGFREHLFYAAQLIEATCLRIRSTPPTPLSRLLPLKKALVATFSVLSGAHTPTPAPLDFLFSVTNQGTNGLLHSAATL